MPMAVNIKNVAPAVASGAKRQAIITYFLEQKMTDTSQPEYCDCPGYHDGSCRVRHMERLEKKAAAFDLFIEALLAMEPHSASKNPESISVNALLDTVKEVKRLKAELERTEHDRNLLAAEVQAWRHNDDVHECSLTTGLEFLHKRSVKAHDRACEAAQRTDESGALQRAKEAK